MGCMLQKQVSKPDAKPSTRGLISPTRAAARRAAARHAAAPAIPVAAPPLAASPRAPAQPAAAAAAGTAQARQHPTGHSQTCAAAKSGSANQSHASTTSLQLCHTSEAAELPPAALQMRVKAEAGSAPLCRAEQGAHAGADRPQSAQRQPSQGRAPQGSPWRSPRSAQQVPHCTAHACSQAIVPETPHSTAQGCCARRGRCAKM